MCVPRARPVGRGPPSFGPPPPRPPLRAAAAASRPRTPAPRPRRARFSPAAINFPRYKIVVQSVVGQQKQQGVRVASRCLWDTDTDNFSTYTFTNDTLWCTVMCFGLWVE
jgi:hypothetical protein